MLSDRPSAGDVGGDRFVGTIEHIHIAEAAGAPMRRVEELLALKGLGLAGDRYAVAAGFWRDGKVSRDLTPIESEAIEELERTVGVGLEPGEARRNLTTRGSRAQPSCRRNFLGRRRPLSRHAPL